MFLSHKIALNPTDVQRRYFAKAAGCARFVYNLALDEWNRRYAAGEKCDVYEIKKDFNANKYFVYPWMKDVHKDAHSRPFIDLGKAFKAFFNKESLYPKFKKKGKRDSFYISYDDGRFEVARRDLKLPRIGWVKMQQELRFDGRIVSAVVSRTADKWFISIMVDVGEYKKERTANGIVGVDLGIKTAATLSTGEKIDAPKPLVKLGDKLKSLQRKQSRQILGGKNREKTNNKMARLYAHMANIRKDFWHKQSTKLCRENQAIAIEDLNVQGMMTRRNVAKSFFDIGLGMFKSMLRYKHVIYNDLLLKADRWFPSSKTCNVCKSINNSLTLDDRVWSCESCSAVLDRDVNAAINLKSQIPLVKRKSTPEESRVPSDASMNQETLQACA